MTRFLFDNLSIPTGTQITLSREQSHHLAKVVRIEVGEEVEITDGRGRLAKARVDEAHAKTSKLTIIAIQNAPSPPRVTLAFAIPKSIAMEFIVRRCTEVGIHTFQPLVTQFSQAASTWNEDRWLRVIQETCKQCQQLHFPVLEKPLPLRDWIERRLATRPLFFCDDTDRSSESSWRPGLGWDLLVGAEGGLSEGERELAYRSGASPLGLGPNRLRAETACLAGLFLLQHLIRSNAPHETSG